MAHAILTAIGADRAGLVDEVSGFILDRGGNIEDSRMVNLRGQFAMMMLVGGDEAVIGRLAHEQKHLAETSGLQVAIVPAPPARTGGAGAGARAGGGAGGGAAGGAGAGPAMAFRFVATAVDRAGIVHRLSHLLREMNVNIESLETRLSAAPYTGAPVFEMESVLSVPGGTPVSLLRQRLSSLGDELNMDWELKPA